MAGHEPAHAQRRYSLGMGDLALGRAEHAVEELRPTHWLGIQPWYKKEFCDTQRLRTVPWNHPCSAARMPNSVLRRGHFEGIGPPPPGLTSCDPPAVCLFHRWGWQQQTSPDQVPFLAARSLPTLAALP